MGKGPEFFKVTKSMMLAPDNILQPATEALVSLCKRWRVFGDGSGVADASNALPLATDTSQQPLLMTPQHA